MPTSTLLDQTAFAVATRDRHVASRPVVLRALLIAGCIVAVAMAVGFGQLGAEQLAEPALGHLLRGIALLKALAVCLAVGLLWWRFGKAVSRGQAAAYVVGVWLAAAGSVLIWQFSHIGLAAVGFHLGEIAFLIVAWRDRGLLARLSR